MTIPAADLKIETYPDLHNHGGQRVGVRSGIKITHLPTGLVAIVETERSQRRNRDVALDMILGGLTSPHFRG